MPAGVCVNDVGCSKCCRKSLWAPTPTQISRILETFGHLETHYFENCRPTLTLFIYSSRFLKLFAPQKLCNFCSKLRNIPQLVVSLRIVDIQIRVNFWVSETNAACFTNWYQNSQAGYSVHTGFKYLQLSYVTLVNVQQGLFYFILLTFNMSIELFVDH